MKKSRIDSVLNNHVLALLVIVITLCFSMGGYYIGGRLMLQDARDDAASLALSSGDFIASEITRFELLPKMAQICSCVNDLLLEPDNKSLINEVNLNFEKLVNLSEAQVVYLMNAEGTTLASSNWKSEKTFVGKNYKIRPYFMDAMKNKMGRYVALGLTSKKLGYYLATSVVKEGEILGVLVVKLGVDELHEKLLHQFDQRSENIMIADNHGIIFLSTKPDWLFRSLSLLSSDEINKIKQHKTYAGMQINPLPLSDSKPMGKKLHFLNVKGMEPHLLYNNYLQALKISVNISTSLNKYYDIRRFSLFSGVILGLIVSFSLVLFTIRERYQNNILAHAITDPLTGLYTRFYLQEFAPRLFSMHKRDPKLQFAVALLDLDHFKQINDTHGHVAGDRVLSVIGKLIQETIRQGDIAIRYGGEEFLLIMPYRQTIDIENLVERIRQSVEVSNMDWDGTNIAVTISGGIAFAGEESMHDTIDRADKNLYEAKRLGRNKIIS